VEPVLRPGFETVVCNLCGAAGSRPFAQRDGLGVVACVGCGLVYVNPRFDAPAVKQHYNSGESSRIQYYLDAGAADRRSFAEILERAEKVLPGRGRVLDVGPNVGTCLVVARERGWETHGIEINAEAARYCREQRGLDVVPGTLERHTYPAGSFDVILMGDVIEHLRDPLGVLRVVLGLLRPGGIVMISTPNIARWAGRLLQIKPEEHLYYFTPATMGAMLDEAGFVVEGIECMDRHRNLTGMAHSTTFEGLLRILAPIFRLSRRVLGDVVVKLPLRENLLAIARRPGPADAPGTEKR